MAAHGGGQSDHKVDKEDNMTEVENAEKTVRDLEDKRRDLLQKTSELADERQRVSFGAHTGDGKARARLDKVNTEVATQASEAASIEAAIVEANARLEVARRDAAAAADLAAVGELRVKLARFVELGLQIDDAFADIISDSKEMGELLTDINRLGCPSPNANQLRVLGLIALKTAVMQVPWAEREWDFLAPNQRKTFASLVEGWQVTVECNIAARIGDKQTSEAA
jgi:hypothetical protein